MKTTIKYISFACALLMVSNSYAYFDKVPGSNSKQKGNGSQNSGFTAKANCAPPNERLIFQFNDVRAQLNTHGVLFIDKNNGTAAYEVPKSDASTPQNERTMAIFAAALWMGGTDINGQLKLAAAKFADKNDFWTGPLTITPGTGTPVDGGPVGVDAIKPYGDANIAPEVCEAFDKFFTIRKAEVISFSIYWECTYGGVECEASDIPEMTDEVLQRIINWPAHGDELLSQDYYLAPFYDRDNSDSYNPIEGGDYPWYDDILGRNDIECGADRRVSLFGDETHWWVFNDKGNIHTESGGDPIGMEIHAQAFSFTTNDEVNRMTFYNYELINRGTQTLYNTYFAQYVDADLGGAFDDYVGCDVTRGLGYAYNADNFDDPFQGKAGYGANPPAIGVDFFEGPYQDPDGKDNYGPHNDTINGVITPAIMNVFDALADGGIVYKGLGIGYNDGIVDNERFGMKAFNYYVNNAPSQRADPNTAAQYYNYMSGKWNLGDNMYYGGNGFAGNAPTQVITTYAFPDDSDSLNWGTKGIDPGIGAWSEATVGNPTTEDKRFVQSAGPFTLKPGAVNNITVGIVYGRSNEGDLMASVRALKQADTKAQALFDNCFKILNPPNAPLLKIQELENELILMLDNPSNSNNATEQYAEEDDINIVDPVDGSAIDKFYRFEGYQIFQLIDGTASISDITDTDKARLVAQCDIVNGVSRLVNFEFDEELGFSIPTEKVNGENKGIRHTFQVKEDLFASGQRTLVNHKSYYYLAVAYAYNQFKKYDPNDPGSLDGQKMPYIASRINADGTPIASVEAIPHNPTPEASGTKQQIAYGSTPQITRIDGTGNGNRVLDLTQSSINTILTLGKIDEPTYDYGAGPINVKVVDPLNLVGGYFECVFKDYANPAGDESVNYFGTDTASWVINRYDKKGGQLLGSVESQRKIGERYVTGININPNEQIIPEWGVSVEIYQKYYYLADGSTPTQTGEAKRITDPIESTIEFADSSKRWLSFVNDNDAFYPTNWILSGNFDPKADTIGFTPAYINPKYYKDNVDVDPDQIYEKLLSGGIAPRILVNSGPSFSPLVYPAAISSGALSSLKNKSGISRAPSIDIVFTSDKSKWTRCAVIELGRDPNLNIGNALPGTLRKSASVDQFGNQIAGSTGMGWFPGYAIDLENGKRLHMAFGENSFMGSDNGADMIWNPTSRMNDNVGSPVFGGQQPVYVYGVNIDGTACPEYDGNNNWVYDKMATGVGNDYRDAYMNLVWVANTMLTQDQKMNATDCKIRVRINKEYSEYTASGKNGGKPMYSWSMNDIETVTGSKDQLADALKMINVVPNPYYAFSEYERSRIDTRVKITNLPEVCTVKIYNINGKLIRTFKKDSPITSLDWDLKNQKAIPIASGIYLIHVEVPGVGEVIVKFFGGMRQVDLENI